jgi:hypothetical protein
VRSLYVVTTVTLKELAYTSSQPNCSLVHKQLAPKMFIPVLFGHGLNDMFIQPHHCDRIHQAYGVNVYSALFIKVN